MFIRELLGLDRLRLIAAAAKDKGDEVARTTLGLDGQVKSLKELVEAGVEDPAEVEARLAEVSSRLETLEAEKRVAQQRLLELQAAEASRKPLLAEVETLKQRLRKTDGEITETKRQIGRDESLSGGEEGPRRFDGTRARRLPLASKNSIGRSGRFRGWRHPIVIPNARSKLWMPS